jgi:hypothetical protein
MPCDTIIASQSQAINGWQFFLMVEMSKKLWLLVLRANIKKQASQVAGKPVFPKKSCGDLFLHDEFLGYYALG